LLLVGGVAACSSSGTKSGSDQPAGTVATTTTTTATPEIRVAGWSATDPPTNNGKADVQWFRGAHGQIIAVALPTRPQPYPVVVYYHGSSGLFPKEVEWTKRLSDAGHAVVTGCWTPGAPDTVQCPALNNPGTSIGAIFDFATKMPAIDPNRIAVMGVSSGAAPAALTPDSRVKALVADSGLTAQPPNLVAPILVLSGARDPRSASVQAWAKQLRDAGETVEAKEYPNGEHVVTIGPDTTNEATATVIDFLNRKLANA
jgi:acetyl esterase/lipase